MIFEPYRIKVVEPLPVSSRRMRQQALRSAGYNPFQLPARSVVIDLISDSGTSAMSVEQWVSLFRAREDFSGQDAHVAYVKTAERITGFPYIQPVHQGRAAERILCSLLVKPGSVTLSNGHFETTRENIRAVGGRPYDLLGPEPPYIGNIDLDSVARKIRSGIKVSMVIMTMTNNVYGGQPVSLSNLAQVRRLTRSRRIPLVIDASRWADNAYLIREYSHLRTSIPAISRSIFRHADIAYFSSKKDGLSNIGGCLAVRDRRLFDRITVEIIRQESYPSSGGLAARDLAAMTEGMKEAVDLRFLKFHIASLRFLAAALKQRGVRVYEPVGGHGVVILPPRSVANGPFALAARIYLDSGIRTGVFSDSVRLALPRRVYTHSQIGYIAEAIADACHRPLPRLQPVNSPPSFRNFFIRFRETQPPALGRG